MVQEAGVFRISGREVGAHCKAKKQKSRRASVIMEHRAIVAIFYAQITGVTQNSTRRSSHLSPRPNLENLHHPCFFLFCVPFANPSSFCPSLGGNEREILFHFKTIHSQEQGERSRPLLACCCHLPPQFYNLSVGTIPLHAISTLSLAPVPFLTTS